ncbi:type VI secretion system tube protein Hcp [Chromobacterium haemolyticum]|uniref:Hcp1 family type VI secretion system effector n=1 Tax=Chromobacterium haemolyticum TaxID=394935 RepID=A0A1W0CE23_9NEIS|nr:type VI secretion system tube protein Hcp [Chromobacterium haemolyticum]OQS32952.1 hypothetical protein B0T45_20980 [Chromobacterium haemolyticum]
MMKIEGVSGSSGHKGFEATFEIDAFPFSAYRPGVTAGNKDRNGIGKMEMPPLHISGPFGPDVWAIANAMGKGAVLTKATVSAIETMDQKLKTILEAVYTNVRVVALDGGLHGEPTNGRFNAVLEYDEVKIKHTGQDTTGKDLPAATFGFNRQTAVVVG